MIKWLKWDEDNKTFETKVQMPVAVTETIDGVSNMFQNEILPVILYLYYIGWM